MVLISVVLLITKVIRALMEDTVIREQEAGQLVDTMALKTAIMQVLLTLPLLPPPPPPPPNHAHHAICCC